MKKTKDITREDEVTKDMVPEERVQTFHFPKLGVSVEAKSYQEALSIAKEAFKNKK